MPNYNFADQYKRAGLAPGSEIIQQRQESFEKLLDNINTPMILDLTRLYFGFSVPDGTDWFRDIFIETDASFSMIDNERETSVLSACLLSAALDKGHIAAGLAPLVALANGHHTPKVFPELVEEAKKKLASASINYWEQTKPDVHKIKQHIKSTVPTEVDKLIAAPAWPLAAEVINLTSRESLTATKTLTNQLRSVISPLVNQVQNLKEEVSILWWCIGGWSRILEQPFIDMGIELAALMAGIDLAHLTESESAPVAAPAILYRTIIKSKKDANTKISISSAVESLPDGVFQQLKISKNKILKL